MNKKAIWQALSHYKTGEPTTKGDVKYDAFKFISSTNLMVSSDSTQTHVAGSF